MEEGGAVRPLQSLPLADAKGKGPQQWSSEKSAFEGARQSRGERVDLTVQGNMCFVGWTYKE